MKSKFMAGFVATIISLVVVIAGAIFIVEVIQPENEDRLIKIVAFGVIGIWLGLYSWLKPKVKVENPNQTSSTSESQQTNQEAAPREERKDRNSYNWSEQLDRVIRLKFSEIKCYRLAYCFSILQIRIL